jgi:hypothetical protein
MDEFAWAYFVLGIIFCLLVQMFWQVSNRDIRERQAQKRQKKFIKQARIIFPDAEPIYILSVASSDKDALANIERKLRAQADSASAEPR